MDSSKVQTIALTELKAKADLARSEGKYIIIFDTTGNAQVFFRYKAHMTEFAKKVIQVRMNACTVEDATEELRRHLVYSMKAGDLFVINSDKLEPDYDTEWNTSKFPSHKVFDFAAWRDKSNYKSVLTDDEDVDNFGNKGWYEMKDDFQMALLSNESDDEHIQKFLSKIPKLENFQIFKVQ